MKNKVYYLLGRVTLAVLFLIFCSTAYAQNKVVKGKVSDAEGGEGLPGVNVLIKGTTIGVITDANGDYSINVNSDDDVLVFSFVGYQTQEFPVGSQSVVNVSLGFDFQSLSEVVVTGYSVDNRRETTGSVSTVDSRSLQVQPSGNVEQQLQGRVSGVTVITNGQPGTQSIIRVRGFGALRGNEPLYIVDGVPVGSTDFLSPDDIETTTVLKDATAASIYGARAAGGVVVYTTKRGKKGKQKMQVSYNGLVGVTTPGDGPELLNPQEQADWTWNAIRNAAIQNGVTPEFNHPQYGTGNTPTLPEFLLVGSQAGVNGPVDLAAEAQLYNIDPSAGAIYQVIRANREGTDWYDAITRNALVQRHNLGFSGGGENSTYYVGLNLQEIEGSLLHQKYRRYAFRVNSQFDIVPDKVRIGENIQMTYSSNPILLSRGDGGLGSADDENVILDASRMSPIIPVFDEFGGYAGTAAPGFNNPRNPVANLDGQRNNQRFWTEAFGNVYMEVEPIEDLVARTSFGGRWMQFNTKSFTRRQYENSENNSSFGFRQESEYFSSWVWTNTINYKKTFGDSKIDILVGQEALNLGTRDDLNSFGINPFSQNPDFVTMSTVESPVIIGEKSNGINFSSYFGRINYDFQDKYLASVVIRRDGSSRFGSENRWGTFPAFSAAWRISSEGFMDGISWIDDLKIRGGYGIIGNSNNVDPNNQFSLFGTALNRSTYDIGGTNGSAAQGFYRTRIGNPLAKWEKAITTSVGIDALLFDGKLDVILDIWQKETEDLLFELPVTVQTGFRASAPSVNVGEMSNKGIDLRIVYKGNVSEVGYEVTFNGSYLRNELVALAPGLDNLPGLSPEFRGVIPNLNQVGQPLSAFFGFEVVGLFRDQQEVDNAPEQQDAAPGRFRFADINGDGEITLDDRTTLGDPIPDFTGGLTVKLDYKNFELEVYSFASIGNEIYNMGKLFTDFYPLFPGAAISARVKDSWTFENRTGDIPIFENNSNFSTNTQSNSFYVEDGSYFRMQNVTLSYNLPKTILDRLGFEKFKIFASGNNIFTITGYDGLDPSVGGQADTRFGIDLGNVPIRRTWTTGVNITF